MVELVSRSEHEKLYLQLYEILRKKIESKEWSPGMQIPTEEQLCKTFGVSRATVRNAILELVRQGYLIRQQGKGTFVSKSFISEGLLMNVVFKKLWIEDTVSLKREILAKTVMMPIDNLSKILSIPENRHIIYIKILWFLNGSPTILQESFVPYNICPHLLEEELEEKTIVELFEKKYSIKITKVNNYFELVSASKEISSYLNIEEGCCLILMTQEIFSGDSMVLFNKVYKKNDSNRLSVVFHRKTL